jgi:hypothetical protein
VHNVIASNKNVTDLRLKFAADELLGLPEMNVHALIKGNQKSDVFHSPFQADDNWVIDETGEKRGGVEVSRSSHHTWPQ